MIAKNKYEVKTQHYLFLFFRTDAPIKLLLLILIFLSPFCYFLTKMSQRKYETREHMQKVLT